MTDDASDQRYPVELHPDHHALVTNPQNWRQFFDVGDGGIARSNGTFVDDSGDCVNPKGYVGSQLAFCQLVLSRIPERLETINTGLRTLHFYEIAVSPHDPDIVIGGTQDNGSWERSSGDTWVNTNIADGGHNNFDIADPNFRQTAFQSGQLFTSYEPKNATDQNWIADTLAAFAPYALEGVPFIGPATNDPTRAGWLWTGREHLFRSTNYGRNPVMTKAQHREHCNLWTGDFDVDEDGDSDANDICDDWKPLGNPGRGGSTDERRLRCDEGRRHGCGRRAGPRRDDALGGDEHRSHLRLEERERREPGNGRPRPDRRRGGEHAAALPDGDLRRSVGLEPRLDHVQRLQREDAGNARARVRGPVRAGRLDVHHPRRGGRRGVR